PGWPLDGLGVATTAGDQTAPDLVADGSGGAYLTWQDRPGADADIRALRLAGDGSPAPGWTAGGAAPCTPPGGPTPPTGSPRRPGPGGLPAARRSAPPQGTRPRRGSPRAGQTPASCGWTSAAARSCRASTASGSGPTARSRFGREASLRSTTTDRLSSHGRRRRIPAGLSTSTIGARPSPAMPTPPRRRCSGASAIPPQRIAGSPA